MDIPFRISADVFAGSDRILSPSARTCGPPSGTSTRAHVYGISSSRERQCIQHEVQRDLA